MKLIDNEHGTGLCPMPTVEVDRSAPEAWYAVYEAHEADPSKPAPGPEPDPAAMVAVCGADLIVKLTDENEIGTDGTMGCGYATWTIECENGHVLVVQSVDGGDQLAHLGYTPTLAASALSDLTASTPTVDGPKGLTGPSAEGTWYGEHGNVPASEPWEMRWRGGSGWTRCSEQTRDEWPMDAVVEARPVPLPVTEEPEAVVLRWDVLNGDTMGAIVRCDKCGGDGCETCDRTGELHRVYELAKYLQSLTVTPDAALPVTEEVPLAAVPGKKLPGDDRRISTVDSEWNQGIVKWRCWRDHPRSGQPVWTWLEFTPSGMVTVQREGDEK